MSTPATDATTETGRYECPACDARFHVLGDKKQHVRTEHGYGKGRRHA